MFGNTIILVSWFKSYIMNPKQSNTSIHFNYIFFVLLRNFFLYSRIERRISIFIKRDYPCFICITDNMIFNIKLGKYLLIKWNVIDCTTVQNKNIFT